MKINEKNLCAFAISASPVDKEGYLNKRGEVNKSFQKRYFVLKGNLLFYFDKKGDKEPVGVIILEGCTIELAEDEEQFCFKIEFHGTNNRSYVLGAESQESMEQWMKALACAGYDYMKIMVADLQRQLDDIDEQPLPLAQAAGSPVPPPRQRHNPFNKPESSPQVTIRSRQRLKMLLQEIQLQRQALLSESCIIHTGDQFLLIITAGNTIKGKCRK
ncbi:sesquipedalian-1 isoform X2 [Onthophagus taurus]|uniref:sesquipedalian-1 isoform X2 n=1 Tax=Onthophagus taurus TaxID=166361 RepID=UPI000C20EEF3|nr:sesquipedalian-1 isoform X2 [Onthophagus taurus]